MAKVLPFLFIAASCTSAVFAQSGTKPKGLSIDSGKLEVSKRMLNAKTGDSAFCHYSVHYEIYSGKGKLKKLGHSMNHLMRNAITTDSGYKEMSLAKRVEKDAEEFIREWEMLNNDPEAEWTFNYTKRQKFGVHHHNKSFVCVKDMSYYFTGGAHGFEVVIYTVLRKRDGRIIENWRELFTDTGAILKLAEQQFRKDKGLQHETATNKDWFWNGKFYLPDNFTFTPDGILFYYNSFEIAPGNNGPTQLLLDKALIQKLLRDPI